MDISLVLFNMYSFKYIPNSNFIFNSLLKPPFFFISFLIASYLFTATQRVALGPSLAGSVVSLEYSGLCANCSTSLIYLYWSGYKCGFCQNRRKLGRRLVQGPFNFYSLFFVLGFLKYCFGMYWWLHKWDHPSAVTCLTISQSLSLSLHVALSFF